MDQTIKEPHTISLKVLRLNRPQLATQDPLPEDPTTHLSHQASLALPSASIDDIFTLTPLLTLPTTFGTAYVGESFSCILSLNNELSLHTPADPAATASVSFSDQTTNSTNKNKEILSIKLAAEMQTPSQTRSLDFSPSLDRLIESGLPRGQSVQSTLAFDLREEGTHVLAVNISYTEGFTSGSSSTQQNESSPAATAAATGGRVRLLRKLYNFNVGPCLSVRTKATSLSNEKSPVSNTTAVSTASAATEQPERYLLECQLENLADDTITMERLVFEAKAPFTSQSLNWDAEHVEVPMLAPREVTQVAFLISEEVVETSTAPGGGKGAGHVVKEMTPDARTKLGVLTIHWRSAMGCLGVLSTGWLASRARK